MALRLPTQQIGVCCSDTAAAAISTPADSDASARLEYSYGARRNRPGSGKD